MDSGGFSWILTDSDLSTRDKVWALRDLDPDITASEISRLIGRSRERIRQILTKLDLETAVTWRLGRSRFPRNNCLVCGKETASRLSKTCSRDCWNQIYGAKMWHFVCPNCGELNSMRESLRRVYKGRGHLNAFCGRKCFHQFKLGKSFTYLRKFSNLYEESL